jgi:hypothetical protein
MYYSYTKYYISTSWVGLKVPLIFMLVDYWCATLSLFLFFINITSTTCFDPIWPSSGKYFYVIASLHCSLQFIALKGAVVLCLTFILCMLWYCVVSVKGGWSLMQPYLLIVWPSK